MKLVLLLAALTAACSTKKPPAAMRVSAQGVVGSIRFEGTKLSFCDAQGPHGVDLKTGRVMGEASPCTAVEEPNTACGGLKMDVTVREPPSEPNDIVDLVGTSFPLQGRVHDCREDGNRLVIVTGSSVVLIDAAKNTMKEIASQGGDRVAVAENWIAWTEGSSVYLAPIP